MAEPMASVVGEPPRPGRSDLDLRDLGRTIWRYKLLIVSIVTTLTVASHFYINSLTPRYRAEASMVLDIRQANVGIDPVIASMRPDDSVIRSEVDVLRSRWLARRVVQELDMAADPEFNPSLRAPEAGMGAWIGGLVRDLRQRLATFERLPEPLRAWLLPSVSSLPAEAPPPTDATGPLSVVIETVLGSLTVLNDGRSYTVDLQFESEDPEKAARIVNAFAEFYLTGQVESKYQAAERGASWLEKKIEELRDRVRQTDSAALEYRRENALLDWGDNTLLDKRLSQFGEEVIAAQRERVRAETRLQEIRDLAAAPLDASSAPALTDWPQLEQLLEKVRAIEIELTGRRSVYGENHPLMLEATAERARLMGQFRQEIARIVTSLESDSRLAAAQEAAFVAMLADLQTSNVEAHRDELELRQLSSEAAAARSLYDTFVASLDRTSVQLDLVQPDARILSNAAAPPWPSYPQRRILLALAVIASFGLSLVIVLVLEFLKQGFRAVDQVERALGTSVVSMVPVVKGARHPSDLALRQPYSTFTESVRLIRSAIDLSDTDQLPRVVLVTSAVPDEGKTAIALTLGRLGTASGRRPLLIDCDLRSPSVASDLGTLPGRGLAEILTGEATIKEVLRVDEASGLYYIPAGGPSFEAIELLGSQRMRDLLTRVGRLSDRVILDSPPVTLVSDPLVLSRLADTTLLVVRWDQTPRSLVTTALKKLHAARANKIAVVLSRVNLARHAAYGFGDFPHRYLKGYLSS